MNEVYLDDLFDLFHRAFPILPDTPENNVRKAIDQFSTQRIGAIQVIRDPLEELSQGDILDPIPFIEWSDKGEPMNFIAPGMVITSTCDLDRKGNIVFCPCYRLSSLGNKDFIKEISENTIFDFFYVDKLFDGDTWAVDLSRPMTLLRNRVIEKINNGDISKKHSLTDKGWYLFITKFSMKYFRPDDFGTMQLRKN
ncbi:MAG: hypothetical protein IM531_04835 [Pseudanabaena sp. M090S1SP1A06QC]|jgi:hypothetical protein|nr:hypothetical protein [Pseudanabaena sp. M051S1SP1A06QC]MCA6588826.1 hypothetical protein [Pseudanabaena sp. M109S1SP1A06QC]MCA6605939.1 hypothetical protein [Pseudanabaena sp. M007S1SP1A06QC]MCA6614018.1 hypothetical protein [Pseudanabaena sp. M090S1SP1A06QC]MCA6621547.1 hypothetical protein [Pseudanabaena sp. M165S2SP1A06QC]